MSRDIVQRHEDAFSASPFSFAHMFTFDWPVGDAAPASQFGESFSEWGHKHAKKEVVHSQTPSDAFPDNHLYVTEILKIFTLCSLN